jgi:hypothetical protein
MAIWGLFMATKARAWANSNKLAPQKANSRQKYVQIGFMAGPGNNPV